tara:strand:+ start:5249 stop:6310 length:1062 start_codon:yes stop_codon:yes gene_type:complete
MAGLYFQEKGYQYFRTILGTANKWGLHDYEKVVHAGQAIITRFKIPSLYKNYSRYLSSLNIKRSVFSLQFDSPITFAAFESHFDSLEFWLNLGCGGGCIKTIKYNAYNGNPRPRMQNISINGTEHLINALGLPGPGVNALIEKVKKSRLPSRKCPIGFSIGGQSLPEYQQVVETLIPYITADVNQPYIEINISCPNTTTGTSMHDNLDDIESLIRTIRKLTPIVLVIKVSPDATDENLCDIAKLATEFDHVTLNAGNTQLKSTTDVGLKPHRISIGRGGLSGPSLFNRTLDMANLLSQFNLPLISTGGITNSDQIEQLLNSGVSVVGMATQLVKNPFSIIRMNKALDYKLNNH